MAADEQIETLLRMLVRQTSRGLIKWENDPPGGFLFREEEGGVRISSRDSDDNFPFDLQIQDPEGRSLAEASVEVPEEEGARPEDFDVLIEQLYFEARDSARNVTPVLNSLIARLEANEEPF